MAINVRISVIQFINSFFGLSKRLCSVFSSHNSVLRHCSDGLKIWFSLRLDVILHYLTTEDSIAFYSGIEPRLVMIGTAILMLR